MAAPWRFFEKMPPNSGGLAGLGWRRHGGRHSHGGRGGYGGVAENGVPPAPHTRTQPRPSRTPHAHPAATPAAARARSRDDLRQRRTGTNGSDELRQRRICHERQPAARSSRGEVEAVAKKKKTQVFLVLFLLFDTPCFLSVVFFSFCYLTPLFTFNSPIF